MKFASTGAAFAIFLHTELASSAPCQGSECVSLYSGAGCKSSLTNFIPTCEGNCFQMGFDSLGVSGNGFKGTDCHVYSDTNCQNQILDTGNEVEISGCFDSAGAQSMKCFFDC
ncbi:hypothetical protein C8R43DRAFT_916772 [Mycena crocata]|nr:hypothetical protein C8R43DRAFT_916772 [Mycena crocata]